MTSEVDTDPHVRLEAPSTQSAPLQRSLRPFSAPILMTEASACRPWPPILASTLLNLPESTRSWLPSTGTARASSPLVGGSIRWRRRPSYAGLRRAMGVGTDVKRMRTSLAVFPVLEQSMISCERRLDGASRARSPVASKQSSSRSACRGCRPDAVVQLPFEPSRRSVVDQTMEQEIKRRFASSC